jgi:class 3 adenylate cyclase
MAASYVRSIPNKLDLTTVSCPPQTLGVPEPQSNHAVIMCKFARDCMVKTNELTSKLKDQLGQDTGDISFRVGLNSGPITGGVLRGQKGRFQLFGDSINTAARMETNGVKGKIHASEATANALREQGCGHWLVERPDKIEVKGKGLMTTYFVHVSQDKGSIATRSMQASVCGHNTPRERGVENRNSDVEV